MRRRLLFPLAVVALVAAAPAWAVKPAQSWATAEIQLVVQQGVMGVTDPARFRPDDPLTAGALAQWAPEPRVLCYLIALVVIAAATVAALSIPEPARATGTWRIQRPSVPSTIRAGFARASLTGAAAWAVAALFLSVVPSYAAKLLDTHDLALLGAIAATMLATSCAAQALAAGRGATAAQPLGLTVLVCGLVALVAAFPLHSLPVVLAAAILAGAGHGLAFLGGLTTINNAAPADRHAEVLATFYVIVYLGVGLPTIGVGFLATAAGLLIAVQSFAYVVAALCLAVLLGLISRSRREVTAL
jgi:hypothetical protein